MKANDAQFCEAAGLAAGVLEAWCVSAATKGVRVKSFENSPVLCKLSD